MRSIKKVFFLVAAFALFGIVALAPNVAGAVTLTNGLKIVEFGPMAITKQVGNRVDIILQATTDNGTATTPITFSTTPSGEGAFSTVTQIAKEGNIVYFKTSLTSNQTASASFTISATDATSNSPAVTVNRSDVTTNITLTGGGCSQTSQCAVLNLNGSTTPLECEENACVPQSINRAIGTTCTTGTGSDRQCETGTTAEFDFTCGSDQHCVGSVANVQCLNTSQTLNRFFLLGEHYLLLDSTERCDIGLLCDQTQGTCVNDIGQGAVPAGSLGEASQDIRDQIRNLINIALGFLGVAGVIVTLYGGFICMTAFGDDEKVGKAKKTIVAGMIGIVIIGVAWTIVSYVLKVAEQVS